MQIKFNDPIRQYNAMRAELEEAVLGAMSSGWWLSGARTESFSVNFKGYLNIKHVLPVANGTDALELCLRATGAGEGTEVITVANAGGYTSAACRSVGAIPVYVDIDDTDLLISIDRVIEMLSDRTVAVVATHLYGNMVDISRLRHALDSCSRKDIRIIEDCAQAHGASINGKYAGSFGDIAAFSFYPTKNLGALGDAGAVATNNDQLAEKASRLRQYGWGDKYNVIEPFGRNSRIDEIQAAVLDVKLKYLDAGNNRRRDILERYSNALSPDSNHRVIWRPGRNSVGHLAVMVCHSRKDTEERLNSAGVQTAVHYPILDTEQPAWKSLQGRSDVLTNSVFAARHIISLPCYPELEDSEIDHICSILSTLPASGTGDSQ